MKALVVIGIIAIILFLIGLIRVGAEAIYDEEGFRVSVRFWLFRIRLGGGTKPSKKKEDKEQSAEPEEKEPKKRKKLPPLSLLFSVAKHGYAMLCRLVSRVRVDVLKLHFTSAFDDPAVAALAYGAAGTAMDTLRRIGGSRIVCSDMCADVDFNSIVPRCDFRIGARLRIGRIVGSVLRCGFGILIDLLREKRKEHTHGKSSDR